ncbi:nucleoside diphosphate kinase 3-like [Hibiscus syriacus]|uniref:nucleoside diphosphate kinase 3-like n=1 Tax=Hibiscus syriacus TaxID=106335 RepID=UPI0019203E52|nr:nucleoside diphosphate kinase 3-like [Hibiscus syriacus]
MWTTSVIRMMSWVDVRIGCCGRRVIDRRMISIRERRCSSQIFIYNFGLRGRSLCSSNTTTGPVIAMVWEGEGVIKYGRKLIGATDSQKSEPGTIRGDLTVVVGRNIIHGSDGPETAKDEINLWFKPQELVDYRSNAERWIYGVN